MATETKTKSKTAKSASSKTPAVKDVQADGTVGNVVTDKVERPIVPKSIDLSQLIPVRSGYQGRLVYKSPRTQEKSVWPEFGSEQMMELLELRNAKNTNKKFFVNNWFMFNDEDSWVVDYLGMRQYYEHALDIDGFDEVFSKSPEEIEETVAKLSPGQRKSLSYRARQLIASKDIDSNKAIAALERSLGVELVER